MADSIREKLRKKITAGEGTSESIVYDNVPSLRREYKRILEQEFEGRDLSDLSLVEIDRLQDKIKQAQVEFKKAGGKLPNFSSAVGQGQWLQDTLQPSYDPNLGQDAPDIESSTGRTSRRRIGMEPIEPVAVIENAGDAARAGLDRYKDKFSEENQIKTFNASLDRRGYNKWKSGKMNTVDFIENLASEWASVEYPYDDWERTDRPARSKPGAEPLSPVRSPQSRYDQPVATTAESLYDILYKRDK